MALQLRRGTDAERQGITPESGEPIWTTDTKELWIGDGSTAGGIAIGGSGPSGDSDQALYTTSSVRFKQLQIGDGVALTISTSSGVGSINVNFNTEANAYIHFNDPILANQDFSLNPYGATLYVDNIKPNDATGILNIRDTPGTNIVTVTTGSFTIGSTATIAGMSIGLNNGEVTVPNVTVDSDNILVKMNANTGTNGSLIISGIGTSNTRRALAIDRNMRLRWYNGACVIPALSSTDGSIDFAAGPDGFLNFYTNGTESAIGLSTSSNTYMQAAPEQGISFQQWVDSESFPRYLSTITSSTFSINVPLLSTTTATFNDVVKFAGVAELRAQTTAWGLGATTATILTISSDHSGAHLQVVVGATFGLDSHTEKVTIDILSNGVDVLNAQSAVLSTTSTGICTYTAELSGTDILVKATLIDPVNFLATEANVMAQLLANPMV